MALNKELLSHAETFNQDLVERQFIINPLKFLLLNTLSWGFYSIWWIYKVWLWLLLIVGMLAIVLSEQESGTN